MESYKTKLQQLSSLQFKMIRKMIKFSKRPWESKEFFMARTNGIIKRVLEQNDIERWGISYHRPLCYSGAGSLGKITRVHEDRMVLQILRWKNIGWVTQLQARFGCQTHHRKLRVWRWESKLVQILSLHWIELAKDRASWIARVQTLTFSG